MNFLLATTDTIEDAAYTIYEEVARIINIVLPVVLGVVLLVGILYAVYLGVKYAKAEEADARKKSKEHLVGAITGFAITLVLIAVIYAVLAIVVGGKANESKKTREEFAKVTEQAIAEDLHVTGPVEGKYTITFGTGTDAVTISSSVVTTSGAQALAGKTITVNGVRVNVTAYEFTAGTGVCDLSLSLAYSGRTKTVTFENFQLNQ